MRERSEGQPGCISGAAGRSVPRGPASEQPVGKRPLRGQRAQHAGLGRRPPPVTLGHLGARPVRAAFCPGDHHASPRPSRPIRAAQPAQVSRGRRRSGRRALMGCGTGRCCPGVGEVTGSQATGWWPVSGRQGHACAPLSAAPAPRSLSWACELALAVAVPEGQDPGPLLALPAPAGHISHHLAFKQMAYK